MPIYEYRCEPCGFEKEYLQKVNDAPVAACPACGSEAYTKLISAAGFQLKGSGWYATDFKNKGSAPAKKESSSSSSSGEGKGESGSKDAAGGGSCGGSCACH